MSADEEIKESWWQKISDKRVLLVASMIAASQGLYVLNELPTNYLYKDTYHFGPAQVSLLTSMRTFPWTFKYFWGVISDNISIFGYRRKPYIFIFGLLAFGAQLVLAVWSEIMPLGISLIFLISVAYSFYNAIGDALLVESAQKFAALPGKTETEKEAKASNNVSLFFAIRYCAAVLASYFGGFLLDYITPNDVFRISSFVPLSVAISAIILPETLASEQPVIPIEEEPKACSMEDSQISLEIILEEEEELLTEKDQEESDAKSPVAIPSALRKIWNFSKQPEIYKPVVLLFMFQIAPSTSSTMFYFFTNQLGFSPDFMGALSIAGALAIVFGIFLYNYFLKGIPFKKILFWSSILYFFLQLSQIVLVTRTNVALGIPDKIFCLCNSVIINVFSQINSLPIFVMVCKLCPQNLEGTTFALFLSIFSLASVVGNQIGALILWILDINQTNFKNLWIFILISSSFLLFPMLWLNRVRFDVGIEKANLAAPKVESLQHPGALRRVIKFKEATLTSIDYIPKRF